MALRPDASPPRGSLKVRGVLIVAAVVLWVWAEICVLLFPALLINDADNGRFVVATSWSVSASFGARCRARLVM